MFYCRLVKKEEVPEVVRVMHNTGYVQFYPGKSDSEIQKEILKSRDVLVVCVEKRVFKHEQVVGYFIFSSVKGHLVDEKKFLDIDESFAFHCGVGVLRSFRRKGLGKKLTNYALKLTKKNYRGMYASVGSNNHASLKLQESLGVEKLAEYKCKYRKECNNVLFVKTF